MRRPFAPLCVLCALFLSYCGAQRAVTENIVLYVPLPETAVAKPLPYRVYVKELELARLYDNANVVVRLSDHTVQFAKRGAWAVRPNLMASDLLMAVFAASVPCRVVTDRQGDKSPDYVIGGKLRVIEEDARTAPHGARLELALQFVRYEDESPLVDRLYRAAVPLRDTTYAAFARAASEGFRQAADAFVKDAAEALKREQERSNASADGQGL